jgi:hypothetical protein
LQGVGCRGAHRCLEESRRVGLLRQERFDLGAKIAIATACVTQECGPLLGGSFERGVTECLDMLPTT